MAHIIASIDEALGVVAKNTGFPLDQVRYVVWYDESFLKSSLLNSL